MRAHLPSRRLGRSRAAFVPAVALWAAAALLGPAGCVEQVGPEARKLVVDGKHAYERGDDADAVRCTSTFLAKHANSDLADVAYYLRGLAKYRQKDTPGAKADLKAAASRTQRKDVRQGSVKALGDLAFEEGDVEWAETLYRQTLEDLDPKKKPADEVRYRLGCTLQRKGRWADADQQFDRVVHVFPGTEAARRAERRLRCLAWTVQTGAFARRDLAEAEARRLRAAKLSATSRPATYGGKLRFCVQVGMHETYAAARAALPGVKRLRKDALVVPTR